MHRILIVEDDVDLAAVTESVLVEEGFTVEVAVNGLAGLQAIVRQTPDLVLLDMMLPVMSGPEMLAELRALRHRIKPPRILITTAIPDMVPRDEDPLYDAVLVKPVRYDVLVAAVRRALSA